RDPVGRFDRHGEASRSRPRDDPVPARLRRCEGSAPRGRGTAEGPHCEALRLPQSEQGPGDRLPGGRPRTMSTVNYPRGTGKKTYGDYVAADLEAIDVRAMTLYALSDRDVPWPLAYGHVRKHFEK